MRGAVQLRVLRMGWGVCGREGGWNEWWFRLVFLVFERGLVGILSRVVYNLWFLLVMFADARSLMDDTR
jgi:hypothetical protein